MKPTGNGYELREPEKPANGKPLYRLHEPLSHGMRLTDALIGATAIVHGATLVTANTKHFGAVQNLVIEAFIP